MEIEHPAITVIIPTYNWSPVLPFSIGSVLRQTFTDFEVLVVGDGCTDDSQSVVEAISDDRVRWINLESNSGHQSAPNNEGLRQARGPLVAYLGHDDLWLPHHLECLVQAIGSGADLAYGIVALVKSDDSTWEPYPSPLNYERGTWIPPSGVMHRREIVEAVGGWRDYRELTVVPELDLWQRVYDANYRIAFVPRLSAIKFPAAHRRDAYKNRSSVEQAHWSQRIVSEPDFEVTELMKLLLPALEESRLSKKHIQYNDLVAQFVAQTCKRVMGRLSSSPSASSKVKEKGELIDEYRKFKGL